MNNSALALLSLILAAASAAMSCEGSQAKSAGSGSGGASSGSGGAASGGAAAGGSGGIASGGAAVGGSGGIASGGRTFGSGGKAAGGSGGATIGGADGGGKGGEGGSAGGAGGGGTGNWAATGVTVHLTRVIPGPATVSFGLPVPAGALASASDLKVTAAGAPVATRARSLIQRFDAQARPSGILSVLVQLPESVMRGADEADIVVGWTGGSATSTDMKAFADETVSGKADEIAKIATRTIRATGSVNQLVETGTEDRIMFSARMPRILATFPAGYLADVGIFGMQTSAADAAAADTAGLKFFVDSLIHFTAAVAYESPYRANPDSVLDLVTNFEAWLYDRCTTFLLAHAYSDDILFLKYGMRNCSYYAGQIQLTGTDRGIFTGKPSRDEKYSHQRGVFSYYALTGDEAALEAVKAMADLWLNDTLFVGPYRAGHVRGPDKLWTERLLGTSMEGLHYGYRATGTQAYFTAFQELLNTAYAHITGDAAALALINPTNNFPPQNCFIHNSAQHEGGLQTDPWCSGWMNELVLDVLLQHQDMTQDPRVDEILLRLARYMRDTGSCYFKGDPLNDSFLKPSICYKASDQDKRMLVPMYGSGIDGSGTRRTFSDWSDFEHCSETTSITAAGLRALKRQNKFDRNPIAPFASEGESLMALHHEYAACALWDFDYQTRSKRDPRNWTSSELAAGLADPAAFIASNKIGWPTYNVSPLRKLSWWFNQTMFQFKMLKEVGIAFPTVAPGGVQPAGGCN
jgi:hypothetical protein